MARRRVAKGKAARERRYEAAVYRQIRLIAAAPLLHRYEDAEYFLRRGDTLAMFTEDGTR